MIAAALVLLLMIGVLVFVLWKREHAGAGGGEAPRVAQTAPAATEPAEAVLDEDRILFGGVPRVIAGGGGGADLSFKVLKNTAYISGYSESRKDPLWVAYRLFNRRPAYNLPRPTGGFITDQRIDVLVKDSDFRGTGYDRGHMAPNSAIARCFGGAAQLETFLLTNVCPQTPPLNQDVWERLESLERAYLDTLQEVWVIDGPIFADLNGGRTQRLPSGIAVPSAFYKIVIDEEGSAAATQAGKGRVRLFAVIMPQNVKGTEQPQQFVTSVREIEKQTRLDFLWKLEDGTEEELETKVWPVWPRPASRN
jgi:endonuclease G